MPISMFQMAVNAAKMREALQVIPEAEVLEVKTEPKEEIPAEQVVEIVVPAFKDPEPEPEAVEATIVEEVPAEEIVDAEPAVEEATPMAEVKTTKAKASTKRK